MSEWRDHGYRELEVPMSEEQGKEGQWFSWWREGGDSEFARKRPAPHGGMEYDYLTEDYLNRLEARIRELEAALGRYGQHRHNCSQVLISNPQATCICGLREALMLLSSSPVAQGGTDKNGGGE